MRLMGSRVVILRLRASACRHPKKATASGPGTGSLTQQLPKGSICTSTLHTCVIKSPSSGSTAVSY